METFLNHYLEFQRMATIYDINASELIDKASSELSKIMEKPEWSEFVKTGVSKKRAPVESDWWFKRSASILRTVYIRGPIGTNKLKGKYGSKKNRGYVPEKRFEASGKIIRSILQQLEKLELVKQVDIKKHKGRKITPKGKSFLDKLSK